MVSDGYANSRALNWKEDGQWHSYSTLTAVNRIRAIALGLINNGVRRGDTVGIMGHPSPVWVMADLAIMSIGAVTVPLFPEEPPETRSFKIDDAGIRYLFLLDAVACSEILLDASKIKLLIAYKGSEAHDNLITIEQLVESGVKSASEKPENFVRMSDGVSENDLATIYYTSGSTGKPKGVELTHANLVSQIHAAGQRVPLLPDDVALSCLPLAHSLERFLVLYYFANNVPVYFNNDVHTFGDDLRDVRPTIVTVVPLILEKLHTKFTKQIGESSFPVRLAGRIAVRWAGARDPETEPVGITGRIADVFVFSKLRSALGGRLRVVITGGAALSLDLYRFFVNADVPVYQGYGMTETSPVISANSPLAHKIGTVGTPFPGVQVRISEDGEILVKGPNVMRGYHNRPEETAKVISADGWIHTGDSGEIDGDGYLTVTGRIKELFKTSCGEYVVPAQIEYALNRSPLVDMAMVIGEGRQYVTCLIFPDITEVKAYRYALGMKDQPLTDFIRNGSVKKEIEALIEDVNLGLEHWEQIRNYTIIPDSLTVSNGMITPTMKIRRHAVSEKYKAEIENMYAN